VLDPQAWHYTTALCRHVLCEDVQRLWRVLVGDMVHVPETAGADSCVGRVFPSHAAEAGSRPATALDNKAMQLASISPLSLVPSSRVGTGTQSSGICPM
jgi:hypothetical protein